MIDLTRLNGHRLVINCDLIKCAEASPDTTLSLVTGEKVIVREPLDHLIALITAYRASILKATWPEAANALAALASIAALPCDGPLHRRDDL
jgi:flagellar protein FlbD